jgi:gliding motility-associated-like protein
MVTDANTCSLTDSITISEPATLTATATTTDVSCKGGTDGTASLSLSGGTAPYVIDWGFVSPLALPAGLHAYTITDDNGCTFTDTVSITEPTALQHSITTTDVLCNGETTGTATLDTTGGTAPYIVDWQGEDPAALSAGTYTVLVTDAMGCDSTLGYTIAEPTPLTLDTSITNTTCNGFTDGSITVSTTGGTAPYSYNWSTGATTSTLTTLGAGTYSVIVTDDNGCADSITATITDPALFAVTISGDGTLCLGDSTLLTADNGDTFSWFTGEITQDITFYPSSDTLAWVTAMQGPCSASDTVALTVYPLPVVNVGADTTIDYGTTITLSSNAVGTYYWYPAGGLSCTSCESPVASPETDITYYLEVTDSNGCVALDSIIITVNFETDPFVANIFSPNGDGLNDILHVNGLTGDDFIFRIYDRWGNMLFESSDQGQGWDGSSDGKIVNSGEYVYTFSFKDNNGYSIKGHGSVTLVR